LPSTPVVVEEEIAPAPSPLELLHVSAQPPHIVLRDSFPERLGVYVELKLGRDPQDPGSEFPFSAGANDSGATGSPAAPGSLLDITLGLPILSEIDAHLQQVAESDQSLQVEVVTPSPDQPGGVEDPKAPLIIIRDDFPERVGIYLDLKLGGDPPDPGPEFPFSTGGNDSGAMGLPPAPGGLLATTAIGDGYPATTAGLGLPTLTEIDAHLQQAAQSENGLQVEAVISNDRRFLRLVVAPSFNQPGGVEDPENFKADDGVKVSPGPDSSASPSEQIAGRLEQLQRLQDLRVTIEVRFLIINDSFFEQIGVDFDFDLPGDSQLPADSDNAAPTGLPLTGSLLGTAAPHEQSDLNNNGQAGMDDLLSLVQHLRTHDPSDAQDAGPDASLDINGDGVVSIADLLDLVTELRSARGSLASAGQTALPSAAGEEDTSQPGAPATSTVAAFQDEAPDTGDGAPAGGDPWLDHDFSKICLEDILDGLAEDLAHAVL
jgi:hypothetical protein